MKTIKDMDFQEKRVLLRADLDVPLSNGQVLDDYRLQKGLATISKILETCKQLIIIGHAGRPGGKVVPESSLKPVAEKLQELLNQEILFLDDCVQDELPDNKIILLENLRFHPFDVARDEEFAKKLASYADIYVNEAFASWRPHVSTVDVPKLIPGCIGLQYEEELKHLNFNNVYRPFVAILGGAKLKDKIPVIKNLLDKVDYILLGGAMVFTFYKAKGLEIGESLLDEGSLEEAKTLLDNPKLLLPTDIILEDGSVVSFDQLPNDKMGLDVGPDTINKFIQVLRRAKTVVWNGPLGKYEDDRFAEGTKKIAEFLAHIPCTSIIGGGDTAAVINNLGLQDKFTHVSTGGGASLKLLEGTKLPALNALEN